MGQCMVSDQLSNADAIVIDANVIVAISSGEAGRDAMATAELTRYASLGYKWFAPGVIIAETPFALCGKLNGNILSPVNYATAIRTFQRTMRNVLPPPNGDIALIQRSEQIASGYGCSRSADSIYIALAEQLAQTRPTVLITFDKELPKQAARHTPTVKVLVL